jgi:hypothetical protein
LRIPLRLSAPLGLGSVAWLLGGPLRVCAPRGLTAIGRRRCGPLRLCAPGRLLCRCWLLPARLLVRILL